VEITSGTADILIRYSDLCEGNEAFCKAFQEYNTYLQLGLLGSGLLKAKFTASRAKAQEAYETQRDVLVHKLGVDDPVIKELDGHFGVKGSSNNWITSIGQNIDNLLNAPDGYQFYNYNGKRFLRRLDASNVDTPRLTIKNGKIQKYDGKTIVHLSENQINDLAINATKNANTDKVMLGKYNRNLNEVSYNRAAGTSFTYFEMDNWDEVYKLVNESDDELWKINQRFIRNQFDLQKPFYFSHDPNNIIIVGYSSFYKREIDLLKQLVKNKFGKTAKFTPSNKYWKLEW